MVFLLLLRRLSPRTRMITGVILVAAGLVVVALSTVVAGLLIHGMILTAIGVAMCASAVAAGRRARRAADRPTAAAQPARKGPAHVR